MRLPGFFSREEIAPMQTACHADPTLRGALMALADSQGNAQELVLYTELSNDLVGVIPRLEHVVMAAEALLGGSPYHWHSKLSMKQPASDGTWDWHQDYGYWYHQGVLRPDMLTVAIAVDENTAENGCMSVVKGSHLLGRIEHGRKGEATGVDQARLEQVLESLERVEWPLDVGDAVYFHCNLLHASGPNRSARPRTLIHCSYNAVDNVPTMLWTIHRSCPAEKRMLTGRSTSCQTPPYSTAPGIRCSTIKYSSARTAIRDTATRYSAPAHAPTASRRAWASLRHYKAK